MNLVISLGLILIFILVYSFFIQLYVTLFRLTGLTKEKARYQTISLITCCGFTTAESEIITNNPARRKIALACMLTGTSLSVIIVSLVINLFFNLKPNEASSSIRIIIILVVVFLLIVCFLKIPFIKNFIDKTIMKTVSAFYSENKKENIITLLDVYNEDAIAEVFINRLPESLKDKSLMECDLKNKFSINLLLVKRNGRVLDVSRDTIIQNKDRIVVFGSQQNIKDLFAHRSNINEEVIENKLDENIVTLIDNYGKDAMAEVEIHSIPSFMCEKELYTNGLKDKYQINVLSIKRGDEVVIVDKDTIIENGDVIVVFGDYRSIKNVFIYKKEIE